MTKRQQAVLQQLSACAAMSNVDIPAMDSLSREQWIHIETLAKNVLPLFEAAERRRLDTIERIAEERHARGSLELVATVEGSLSPELKRSAIQAARPRSSEEGISYLFEGGRHYVCRVAPGESLEYDTSMRDLRDCALLVAGGLTQILK